MSTAAPVHPAAPRSGPSRRSVWLLMIVFVLPVAGGWIAATFFIDDIRALGTTNHGRLVSPMQPLQTGDLRTLEGAAVAAAELSGKWTYVYQAGATCGPTCTYNLYRMRQSQLAQGPEQVRLQRWLVLARRPPAELVAELQAADPALRLLTGSAPVPGPGDAVYLVDPAGMIMMSYASRSGPDEDFADARGMIADLRKLLRNTRTQ